MGANIQLPSVDLRKAIYALSNLSSEPAGLAIKAGGNALYKTANTIFYMIDFVQKTKTAADGTWTGATGGTAPTNLATAFQVKYLVLINAAGNIHVSEGAKAATTAAAPNLPPVPDGYSPIGYLLVSNATGANFVPGTTALDVANLTVTYVDLGWVDSGNDAFDQTISG